MAEEPLPGHDPYRGKLAIPYIVNGRVVSIRFRCMEQHDCREAGHGKYLTMPGEPARLYGVDDIHEADSEIHITEGEMDRLILKQCGLHAVGTPGANSWSGHFRVALMGFSRVWVWGDGDQAGAEFVNKVCGSLRQARGVRVPRGCDANDIYLSGGPAAIHELIDQKGR